MPGRRISVANQKGGVGKTTTAVNLAFGLALKGRPTLLVDLDPQANTSTAVLGKGEPEPTIADVLEGSCGLGGAIIKTRLPSLDILPSQIGLAGLEAALFAQIGGQVVLDSRFRTDGLSRYEFVILDTPPSLGLLTINGLAASTEVIIPVSASFFALKGLVQLERTIALVRDRLNRPDLQIGGVLCTFFDYTNVASDVVSYIRARYGPKMFDTIIPKNVSVEEAHSRGQSVLEYAPRSKGALAYQSFVQEVMGD